MCGEVKRKKLAFVKGFKMGKKYRYLGFKKRVGHLNMGRGIG